MLYEFKSGLLGSKFPKGTKKKVEFCVNTQDYEICKLEFDSSQKASHA